MSRARPAGYEEALQTVRVYYGTEGNGNTYDTATHFQIQAFLVSSIINNKEPELGPLHVRKILAVRAGDIKALQRKMTAAVVASNQAIGYKESTRDRFDHRRKGSRLDEIKPL